jgi:hypothetical protein
VTDGPWWGVTQAAAHCGITPATWRHYVHIKLAPAADDPGDPTTPPNRRTPRWRPATVTTWHASRAGRGRPRQAQPAPTD